MESVSPWQWPYRIEKPLLETDRISKSLPDDGGAVTLYSVQAKWIVDLEVAWGLCIRFGRPEKILWMDDA